MKSLRKMLCRIRLKYLSVLIILLAINLRFTCTSLGYVGYIDYWTSFYCTIVEVICYILIVYINIFPNLTIKKVSTLRNKVLEDGIALLQIFLLAAIIEVVYCILILSISMRAGKEAGYSYPLFFAMLPLISFLIVEYIVFWNGILRVYLTSVQLGIKWRIIGIVCGFMPFVNIYVLCRIIRIAENEVVWENEKYFLNQTRVENHECRTKYPILFVHGVFFRDFRFFNYWGRIPRELIKNGAMLYYGNQQSAASVAQCGNELTKRIRQVLQETGCDKVNIIAHSKGGLDSRYAISACGAAPYVASLTTINTPHRGCIFADYLLDKVPDKVCYGLADKYDAALKKFGDESPDFMRAVQDLTASACLNLNKQLPDAPQVYYQSVGSKMNYASSGRFPLNISYPLVKHFDGECDGLVSIDSMKWGSNFIYLSVPEGRGISHGDMIDLNRENIDGFDVREFYVKLVHGLKERGF